VNADPEQGLREAKGEGIFAIRRGSPSVGKRECVDVDFTLLTDGRLSGRVTTADGKPASFVKVAIIPIPPVIPQFTVVADEQGHFEVTGREPGQYLVGAGLLARIGSTEWKSRVYYPGVRTRKHAKVIELGDGEWRTDIDFKLPPSPKGP
jgi:hypothetical protein